MADFRLDLTYTFVIDPKPAPMYPKDRKISYRYRGPERSKLGDYTAYTEMYDIYIPALTSTSIAMTVPDPLLLNDKVIMGPRVGGSLYYVNPVGNGRYLGEILIAADAPNNVFADFGYRGGILANQVTSWVEARDDLPTSNGLRWDDFAQVERGRTDLAKGVCGPYRLDPEFSVSIDQFDDFTQQWDLTRGTPGISPGVPPSKNKAFMFTIHNMNDHPALFKGFTFGVDGKIGQSVEISSFMWPPHFADLQYNLKAKSSRNNSVLRLLFHRRAYTVKKGLKDVNIPNIDCFLSNTNREKFLTDSGPEAMFALETETTYRIQLGRGWSSPLDKIDEPMSEVGIKLMGYDNYVFSYQRPSTTGKLKTTPKWGKMTLVAEPAANDPSGALHVFAVGSTETIALPNGITLETKIVAPAPMAIKSDNIDIPAGQGNSRETYLRRNMVAMEITVKGPKDAFVPFEMINSKNVDVVRAKEMNSKYPYGWLRDKTPRDAGATSPIGKTKMYGTCIDTFILIEKLR